MGKKITPRSNDYSKWYNDIVSEAGLAESSDVRGCMVIKPYGFAIWELMKSQLDNMFKETGHENAYFPLFVPKSLFETEEKNAEGFAKECAVVTHYRLKNDSNKKGKLVVDLETFTTTKGQTTQVKQQTLLGPYSPILTFLEKIATLGSVLPPLKPLQKTVPGHRLRVG